MRIYLSGPMSGIEDCNYPAFAAAAADLRCQGMYVINPAEKFEGDQMLDRATYLKADLADILSGDVDAVYVLDGWTGSEGALTEVLVARSIGLPLICYPSLLPLPLLPADIMRLMGARLGLVRKEYDPPWAEETVLEETVLEEAERYVGGARNADYGHPLEDMSRTAKLWSAILGLDGDDALDAEDVALCMIALKVSRLCNDVTKRDSIVDVAGYARCIERMQRRREGKE